VLISVEHSLGGATLTKGATVYGNAPNHIQWTVLFLSINCRNEMTAMENFDLCTILILAQIVDGFGSLPH